MAQVAGYVGRGYRGWLARRGWAQLAEQFSEQGIYRDTARTGIPPGGLYDSVDYLLHRPGVAQKRGGTSYAGPAATGATYLQAVAYAAFLTGPQLIGIGENGHLFKITSGTTTDLGTGAVPLIVERPKFFVGGQQSILVIPGLGDTVPYFYDGTNAPQQFIGGASSPVTGLPGDTDYTLTITGTPTGGAFKLDLTAQQDPTAGGGTGLASPVVFRTAAIAYNASAADVATAINAAVAATTFTFTSSGGALPGTAVVIGAPAGWGVTLVPSGLSGVSLTGGTDPAAQITNTTSGSASVDATSVPTGRFIEPHLERLVVANSVLNQNRIWFSPLLNVTSSAWDLANAWIDFDQNVSGICSLSGALLVWSTEQMWRLSGDTPPPDSNMRLDPISEVGCTDARSIVRFEGQVIFANPRGVYITTGIAPVSLMQDRIESYWQSLFSGYTPSADGGAEWCISCGLYGRRFLFVTVLNASGTLVDTLCCDLPRRSWMRMSNMRARMYASVHAASEELFFASRATNRAVALSGIFSPSSANMADADGTAVAPVLESRVMGSQTLAAFGHAELVYDMSAASGSPTLAVAAAPGREGSSYTAVPESPLAETTGEERHRFTLNQDAAGMSVKLTQSGGSDKTEVFLLQYDERPYYQEADEQ